MQKFDPLLAKKLYEHYIHPLQSGLGITQLRGRFKPSWEVVLVGSLKDLFVAQAREKNLHHYHVGYQKYKPSTNQKHPGHVSDGIVHIVVKNNSATGETTHRLIKVCPEHNPFKLPVERFGA